MLQLTNAFRGATTADIIAWHRPIASGLTLGSILTVWFIFVYCEYTFATFLSRIVQGFFILGAVSTITKRCFVSASDVTANMDSVYESARPCVQKAVQRTFDTLTWSDFNTSAKTFAATFVIAYMGAYISDATLFLLVVLTAFSAPLVYEKKKAEIDAQLKKVQQLSDKYLGMLKTKGESAKAKMMDAKGDAETEFASRKNQ